MTGILHIVVARKPVEGTISENCLKYGTGAINVDGCRVETSEELKGGAGGLLSHVRDDKALPGVGTYVASGLGRWPANLILDESVSELFPQSSGKGGDSSGGTALGQESGWNKHTNRTTLIERRNDSGNASRFFFNFKEQETNE